MIVVFVSVLAHELGHALTARRFGARVSITLTTLGYGDITPQTHAAGALCQVEAITGQFYIAVLVAWLVGNFIADRQQGLQE